MRSISFDVQQPGLLGIRELELGGGIGQCSHGSCSGRLSLEP